LLIVVSKAEGKITFVSVVSPPAVCASNIKNRHPKCIEYYESLFEAGTASANRVRRCPFGFITQRPFSNVPPMLVSALEEPRLVSRSYSGRLVPTPDPERELAHSAAQVIETVASHISGFEYDHLDAALHEIRNINVDITLAAEEYLLSKGIDQNNLDNEMCDSNPDLATIRNVFVASRELSSALSLHEISRAPETAKNESTKLSLLGLFRQQEQVSHIRLRNKTMRLVLPMNDVVARVRASAKYLPKILIDNAIKHGLANSSIRITLRKIGEFVEFTCDNESDPLTSHDESNACERDYRGSNALATQTGNGLGLWLARIICEANGGKISIKYAAGSSGTRGIACVSVQLRETASE
jgi:signal transduction histidine kinase